MPTPHRRPFRLTVFAAVALAAAAVFHPGCARPLPNEETLALDTNNGKPLACWVARSGNRSPVELASDWVIAVNWLQQTESPTALWLYDTRNGVAYRSTDFEHFLTMLDRIPRGSHAEFLHRCGAPFSHNMPEILMSRLGAALDARSITLDLKTETVCVCENGEVIWPSQNGTSRLPPRSHR